jgi:hypothetical protein
MLRPKYGFPQDGNPEQLFVRGASDSQDARWIARGSTYEFRLYAALPKQTDRQVDGARYGALALKSAGALFEHLPLCLRVRVIESEIPSSESNLRT